MDSAVSLRTSRPQLPAGSMCTALRHSATICHSLSRHVPRTAVGRRQVRVCTCITFIGVGMLACGLSVLSSLLTLVRRAGSTSVVANWFDSHIRARRTLARQEGDAVLALGPAVSLSLRSQLGSSADLQSKPSSSGGQCATSACQPEATLRGSAADAPLDTVKQAATFADLKVKVANPPVHGGVSLIKGACAELESSPGGNDSRRSSSTLEAAGVESSRAESRACRVL